MRGLVRSFHIGRLEQTRLGLTREGLATVRAFLDAAGQASGEVETPAMARR